MSLTEVKDLLTQQIQQLNDVLKRFHSLPSTSTTETTTTKTTTAVPPKKSLKIKKEKDVVAEAKVIQEQLKANANPADYATVIKPSVVFTPEPSKKRKADDTAVDETNTRKPSNHCQKVLKREEEPELGTEEYVENNEAASIVQKSRLIELELEKQRNKEAAALKAKAEEEEEAALALKAKAEEEAALALKAAEEAEEAALALKAKAAEEAAALAKAKAEEKEKKRLANKALRDALEEAKRKQALLEQQMLDDGDDDDGISEVDNNE